MCVCMYIYMYVCIFIYAALLHGPAGGWNATLDLLRASLHKQV